TCSPSGCLQELIRGWSADASSARSRRRGQARAPVIDVPVGCGRLVRTLTVQGGQARVTVLHGRHAPVVFRGAIEERLDVPAEDQLFAELCGLVEVAAQPLRL